MHQGEFDPDTIQTVMKNMYIDDLMKSVPLAETAIKLSKQLRELLMKGGFNQVAQQQSRCFFVEIPESERASSVINLPTACALGLKWNVEVDKFVWDVLAKVQALVETDMGSFRL